MIQRKQTLFLLLTLFCSLALAVVTCNFITMDTAKLGVSLMIIPVEELQPNLWHYVGESLVFLGALLALITILLFKNRALQVKLCYLLMLIELGLTLIVSFCPVVTLGENITYENSGIASLIGALGMVGAYFAARHIKKDIELLKSADRIR